jgi:MFS superfamily sulfate permease-like transporter
VLFKKARGEHQDAIIVTLVGCAFFFASSHVLPYIPTILASTLVLYIGLLLMIDGLWKTSGCMVWSEWIIVLGTSLGCTFLGFAQGIAMGLGISVVLHYLLDTYGSVTCIKKSDDLH